MGMRERLTSRRTSSRRTMNATGFRRIALGLDDTIESAHMGHPDFRVHGKIFASLQADNRHGTVKLTPDEQQRFLDERPDAFVPASGAWGRQGWTRVQLDAIDEETLGEAITLAWRLAASARPDKRPKSGAQAALHRRRADSSRQRLKR
jgi:hypothetical protein